MTKRVACVVEGETEQDFVSGVLQSELAGLHFSVVNLRGRRIALDRLIGSIKPLLSSGFACVTTLIDFYGFKDPDASDSAEALEKKMRGEINPFLRYGTQFLPYVQKHEFEALLFSDKEAMAEHLRLTGAQRGQLNKIKGCPEDINHDAPPSKQILQIHRRYHKRIDGIEIVRKIGLAKIEGQCPKFANWLAKLREIAKS